MGGSVPDLAQVGVKLNQQEAGPIRHEVARLLGRQNPSFPGAQPVSFARSHIQELQDRDYYLCEKSDGIRCLLYFRGGPEETHFLIDRNNEYHNVTGLHFPLPAPAPTPQNPHPSIDFASAHTNTLLDGELLTDTYPDGKRRLKYLVFDCLAIDGKQLTDRTLDKRLGHFKELLLKPYHELWRRFPEDASRFAVTVEEKKFQFADGLQLLWDEIVPRLKHGCDGLIFTCRETPYKHGTDENILKWKPVEENTVDFKLELIFPPATETAEDDDEEEAYEYDFDAHPHFSLNVGYPDGEYRPDFEMHAEPHEWEGMKRYAAEHDTGLDGIIVECAKDTQGRWRLNRFRDDRKEPNYHTVVRKVLASIKDGVTKDELLRASPMLREGRKKRQSEAERREALRRQAQRAQSHEHQALHRDQQASSQEQHPHASDPQTAKSRNRHGTPQQQRQNSHTPTPSDKRASTASPATSSPHDTREAPGEAEEAEEADDSDRTPDAVGERTDSADEARASASSEYVM